MEYWLSVKNADGEMVDVEVTEKVYQAVMDSKKQQERERKQKRYYMDGKSIDEYIAAGKLYSSESIEMNLINKEILRKVEIVLDSCTPKQRKRFLLNKIYGFTLTEIAKSENCDIKAVCRSVEAVSKKIKKFF